MALKPPHAKVIQSVQSCLKRDKTIQRFWIAYSGGIDSHVLLHVISSQRHHFPQIHFHAVHINHALNREADQWADHCRKMCEQLQIPFLAIDVDATAAVGQSPEAKAREARYQAMIKLIKPHDCLLTAHHQDDQVETVLLQLMRGSGPKGLAAMPQWTDFGPGLMARPLMDVRREDIRAYAVANQLQWVDDDSNLDTRFDRNYIRHEIIPRLVQRWPSLAQTVSRSARYCAEAVALIDDAAKNLLQDINPGGEPWLPVAELTALSDVQQRNVLRHWIHQQGFNTPSSSQLQQLVQQVLQAAVDASPTVSWQGCEVRRYRQRLYIMPPLQPIFMAQPVSWALEQPLVIPGWGVLSARRDRGRGVAARLIEAGSVTIGFRQGGESIQPKGRAHHHALKKLFQEHGVPPWLRERVPLVYLDGELAAVEDWFIAASYAAKADEEGVIFQWQNPPAAASAPVGDVW